MRQRERERDGFVNPIAYSNRYDLFPCLIFYYISWLFRFRFLILRIEFCLRLLIHWGCSFSGFQLISYSFQSLEIFSVRVCVCVIWIILHGTTNICFDGPLSQLLKSDGLLWRLLVSSCHGFTKRGRKKLLVCWN